MEIQEIREIPIKEFLLRSGHVPVQEKRNALWYSAPYREERTPSFQVNIRKNVWYDYGLGRGGDIFSLAGEFIGSDDFMAQAAHISRVMGGHFDTVVGQRRESTEEQVRKEAYFKNVELRPLYHKALLGYLDERGIDSHIAMSNCEEVKFRLHGKRYFAIGFRNVSGGLEIRNRFFKGCIPPKDVSVILNGASACNLYEGFMDYLSALMLGLHSDKDQLILNSVSNLDKSYRYLDGYGQIHCYLDNDPAGRRTLESLRARYGEKIVDRSGLYAAYKDLNEYLQKKSLQQGINKSNNTLKQKAI